MLRGARSNGATEQVSQVEDGAALADAMATARDIGNARLACAITAQESGGIEDLGEAGGDGEARLLDRAGQAIVERERAGGADGIGPPEELGQRRRETAATGGIWDSGAIFDGGR